MGIELVDKELIEGIGEVVGQALADSAGSARRTYSLVRWLATEHSPTPAAVVIERDPSSGLSRELLLKLRVEEEQGRKDGPVEYARSRAAYAEAPGWFAREHFAVSEDAPIRIGNGQSIILQPITAEVTEMTALLNGMLGIPGRGLAIACDSRTFAKVCGTVIAKVLEQWNGAPRIAGMTVARFVRCHLRARQLNALSQRHPEDALMLPGEEQLLPNPLLLASRNFGDQVINAIVGRSHGDLHTGNILVKVQPVVQPDVFYLIDLAKYEGEAPLTRDPVHLVLCIIAQRMDRIADHQKPALIEALLNPAGAASALVPSWVRQIIEQVDGTAVAWLDGYGLSREWYQQRLLSLVGCGLSFLGRAEITAQDQEWFLRLAARAAAAYILLESESPGGTGDVPAQPADRQHTGITWRRVPGDFPVTWLADMRARLGAGQSLLEIHVIPADQGDPQVLEQLGEIARYLPGIGRDAGLAPEDGAGLAVRPNGQRSAWVALPQDTAGAVLDEDDLTARIARLLSVLASMDARHEGEIGIAVGVFPRIPLSIGAVADLPRTQKRGLSSIRPVRVPAREALPSIYLATRPHEVAAELAARILAQFKDHIDPAAREASFAVGQYPDVPRMDGAYEVREGSATPGATLAPGHGTGGHDNDESDGGDRNSHQGGTGAGEPSARYLTGHMPERAPAGRRISLQAQVTVTRLPGASSVLKPLEVPPSGCEITVTVTAPGLIPLGDLEQDLHVPSIGDSEPIRFGFKTGRAGLHTVTVRAFAHGTFLGELSLEVSVEVGASMEEGPVRFAPLGGLAAEPGEVTLQVSRTDDDRYSFQLFGEALYPVELTRRLAGDPAEVIGALVQELRAMATNDSPYASPALVRNRLRNLGAQLWADVVPEAIRRQFWAQADRISLFTVASDMDTVPWELLYPVDGDNDNGFLVEQFPVVRRVYGQGRVRHLSLASAAYIIPPGSPTNAMDEVTAIRARLGDAVRDRGVCSRLDSLIALLDDSPSVLHFACHNSFTDKAGSLITLDGGPLRPSDLAIAVQARRMANASPLVFFNACRTAGEIPGLVQMVGWARQFMGAGAGAFIGSLWAVRSGSAKAFADAFYNALAIDREPLGKASLRARRSIAEDSGDPTWLAYTIYGNPSATFR